MQRSHSVAIGRREKMTPLKSFSWALAGFSWGLVPSGDLPSCGLGPTGRVQWRVKSVVCSVFFWQLGDVHLPGLVGRQSDTLLTVGGARVGWGKIVYKLFIRLWRIYRSTTAAFCRFRRCRRGSGWARTGLWSLLELQVSSSRGLSWILSWRTMLVMSLRTKPYFSVEL